jgi:hypothetical protein
MVMKYYVTVNKRVQHIRSYNIIKKVSGNQNALSKAMQKLVDRYLLKKKGSEEV